MPKDTAIPSQTDLLQAGGKWDRQRQYGGKRLRIEFQKGEEFILWGMRTVGEITVGENDKGEEQRATKSELVVSRIESPDERFEVGDIGKAIAELAEGPEVPGDFPVIAHWDETPTKRNLQPAVILVADRPYVAE